MSEETVLLQNKYKKAMKGPDGVVVDPGESVRVSIHTARIMMKNGKWGVSEEDKKTIEEATIPNPKKMKPEVYAKQVEEMKGVEVEAVKRAEMLKALEEGVEEEVKKTTPKKKDKKKEGDVDGRDD